jgi:hypothetical protein
LPKGVTGCSFEVFTIPPEGYSELGALDFAPTSFSGIIPTDIPALRKVVAKDVCEMGGDAILPHLSSDGEYNHVTILHRVSATPAASAASAAAPAAPAAEGCHYDTQCKGDRICSGGQCVDPPAK